MTALPTLTTPFILPALVVPFLLAYLFSVLGVYLSIAIARRLKRLDQPGDRSSHSMPIPRFGGLGIGAGFFIGMFLYSSANLSHSPTVAIVLGTSIALIFGFLDDLRQIPALPKLAFQCVCAALPLLFNLHFETLRLGQMSWPVPIPAVVTFFWILFFMNAFNFMDGIDGQAGIFGIFAACSVAVPALMMWRAFPDVHFMALASFVLAGALLGFLRFNMRTPARTFMGDCGSQMVGYILAMLLIISPPAFILPICLAYWPFFFDVSFTLVRRTVARKNLLAAHRDHLYQRLLRSGMSHRQVLRRQVPFFFVCLMASLYSTYGYLAKARATEFLMSAMIVIAATVAYTAYVYSVERAFILKQPQVQE